MQYGSVISKDIDDIKNDCDDIPDYDVDEIFILEDEIFIPGDEIFILEDRIFILTDLHYVSVVNFYHPKDEIQINTGYRPIIFLALYFPLNLVESIGENLEVRSLVIGH